MNASRFSDAQKLLMFDDLLEQVEHMRADYDQACEDAFKLAQTLRQAIDAIESGIKLLIPHASVQIVEDVDHLKAQSARKNTRSAA